MVKNYVTVWHRGSPDLPPSPSLTLLLNWNQINGKRIHSSGVGSQSAPLPPHSLTLLLHCCWARGEKKIHWSGVGRGGWVRCLHPHTPALGLPLLYHKNKSFRSLFLPVPNSSFLISLFICDFALICSSCPLFNGRPASPARLVWVGGWLNGLTNCWLAISFSVGDF